MSAQKSISEGTLLDDVKSEPEERSPLEIPDRGKDPAEIYEQRENDAFFAKQWIS